MPCAPSTSATPGQAAKKPFVIPLAVGLVDLEGRDIPLDLVEGKSFESRSPVYGCRITKSLRDPPPEAGREEIDLVDEGQDVHRSHPEVPRRRGDRLQQLVGEPGHLGRGAGDPLQVTAGNFLRTLATRRLPSKVVLLTAAIRDDEVVEAVKLGATYRIETDVYGEGVQDGTTWNGALVLKGNGDPTLSRADLRWSDVPAGTKVPCQVWYQTWPV